MKLWILLLGIPALGCPRQPEPPAPLADFPHAYAGPSCAPWDGFAVAIVLRRMPLAPGDSILEMGDEPRLQLGVYPRDGRGMGASALRPGTFRWPDEPEVAGGSFCENGRCTGLPAGTITIRQAEPDGRLRGAVDLRLADGRAVRGVFDAEWRHRAQLCG
ncbi:MAG: hypothetical protein K0S86_2947 [Geminicoccaceae bacterium]|nr:hypothetical protein [Geminicoccaceae bacterium]